VVVGRPDADDVRLGRRTRVGRRRVVVGSVVPGRDHEQRVGVKRQRVGLGGRDVGRAEARVDDPDLVVARVVVCARDVVGRAAPARVEDAQRQDARVRRDAGDAAQPLTRGDDARHVAAVAVGVVRVAVPLHPVLA
jgi:hypothetical protein